MRWSSEGIGLVGWGKFVEKKQADGDVTKTKWLEGVRGFEEETRSKKVGQGLGE